MKMLPLKNATWLKIGGKQEVVLNHPKVQPQWRTAWVATVSSKVWESFLNLECWSTLADLLHRLQTMCRQRQIRTNTLSATFLLLFYLFFLRSSLVTMVTTIIIQWVLDRNSLLSTGHKRWASGRDVCRRHTPINVGVEIKIWHHFESWNAFFHPHQTWMSSKRLKYQFFQK